MKSVAILLSTYNGEKYLKELLNSIINQGYANYHVYIRDDGSIDNTINILKTYWEEYPNKIEIIKDNLGNIGFNKSFEVLLSRVDSDYYSFCDQDDVWQSNKLKLIIKELEKANNNLPLLAFSDMHLISGNGDKFKFSYLEKTKYKKKTPELIFFSGGVPGCSIIFNSSLKHFYFKKKSNAFLHDSNMCLIATLFGVVIKIPSVTMSYRIHSNNAIGLGKKYPFILIIKDFLKYFTNSSGFRTSYLKNYYKRLEILRREELFNFFDKNILLSKEEIDSLSFFKRKKWFYKYYLNKKVNSFADFLRLIIF